MNIHVFNYVAVNDKLGLYKKYLEKHLWRSYEKCSLAGLVDNRSWLYLQVWNGCGTVNIHTIPCSRHINIVSHIENVYSIAESIYELGRGRNCVNFPNRDGGYALDDSDERDLQYVEPNFDVYTFIGFLLLAGYSRDTIMLLCGEWGTDPDHPFNADYKNASIDKSLDFMEAEEHAEAMEDKRVTEESDDMSNNVKIQEYSEKRSNGKIQEYSE